MPTYVLQVVVETEEDYSKKRVREALEYDLGGLVFLGAVSSDGGALRHTRISVRRDVDKQ